jgi:hypothetical protein
MNAKFLLATLVIAAAATGAARADDLSSYGTLKFEGSRTRAEVAAEAAKVPTARSQEPAGSRVIAPMQTNLDVKTVRDQAVQALRFGKISAGEASL